MILDSDNSLNKLVLASAIALAVGISGCSSSSGGGSTSGGGMTSPPTNVTVGGTTSKGIVKAGVVTADELDTSGASIAMVGSAVTAADGTYSLMLNNDYNGGPIQISIAVDSNTEMKCDVPAGCGTRTDGLTDPNGNTTNDFGEFYKPTSLNMIALVPGAQTNETLSVSVTPYSNMAAVRAKANATLDAAAISNANSEVSNLLGGIDILNTPPVDITDPIAVNAASAVQLTYAALTSALANQGLVDGNGQPDLDAAINLLGDSFVTGVFEADDADGDDAAQLSLQELLTAAEETFMQVGISDTTGTLSGLQAAIDFAEDGDGTIDPNPSTTVADANLLKVKAMMSELRTWGNVIKLETETAATAFDAQVTLASDAVVLLGTVDLFNALGAGIEAALAYDGTTSDLSTILLETVNFTSGTIASSTGVVTITDGVIFGYTVNMTVNLPDDGLTATVFSIGIASATAVGTDNSMSVTSGLVGVTFASAYTIDYDALDLGTALPAPDVTDLTFDLDSTFTQSVDSVGAPLASPVSFAGTMSFDLDPVTVVNGVENLALPQSFNLSGTISNTMGDSIDASLVANITNTGQFQFELFAPEGTLYSANHAEAFAEWSYTNTDALPGDDTFTLLGVNGSRTVYWDATSSQITDTVVFSDGSVLGGFPFGFFTSLADYLAAQPASEDVFADVDGEGEYFASVAGIDFTVDGSLDGMLIDPDFLDETVNNFINANVGLTFIAQLSGLPEARINITADRDAFESGNGTVTLSYGTRQLVLVATSLNSVTGSVGGSLTITNQDSVVLNFTASDVMLLTGNLTFNGIEYATVTETASGFLKVSYIDGTFEIF